MRWRELPIPDHFEPDAVGQVWRVPYGERAAQAAAWAGGHAIAPAAADDRRVCLLAIDVQNTFCLPDFELFVGGRSGRGAVEDNARLCAFIYRNLASITEIHPTLDTHTAMQIFHPVFSGQWRWRASAADDARVGGGCRKGRLEGEPGGG